MALAMLSANTYGLRALAQPAVSAMTPLPPFAVVHNLAEERFEARVQGWLCRLDYIARDGVWVFAHTEVPPLLEGRGIAARLVAAALAQARAEGVKVQPACSYVRAYLRRHPAEQDLLA